MDTCIDYLSGFIEGSEFVCDRPTAFSEVDRNLSLVFGAPDLSCDPWDGYTGRRSYGPGADLLWREQDEVRTSFLQLKGEAWARIPRERWFGLVSALRECGLRATRLDVACDDRVGLIGVSDLWEGYALPRNFSGPLKRIRTEGDGDGDRDGMTIYFGARGKDSQIYLRVYDKSAQLSLAVPWVRWELQTRSRKAERLWMEMAEATSEGAALKNGAGAIIGFVDFWEGNEDVHQVTARRKRPGWWERFREGLEAVTLGLPEVAFDKSLGQLELDIGRDVAVRMWVVYAARVVSAGDELSGRRAFNRFVSDLLTAGQDRINTPRCKKYREMLVGLSSPAVWSEFEGVLPYARQLDDIPF